MKYKYKRLYHYSYGVLKTKKNQYLCTSHLFNNLFRLIALGQALGIHLPSFEYKRSRKGDSRYSTIDGMNLMC